MPNGRLAMLQSSVTRVATELYCNYRRIGQSAVLLEGHWAMQQVWLEHACTLLSCMLMAK